MSGEIGVGVIGTGFMGVAHALALEAVGPLFEPKLRPRLELVADIDEASVGRAKARFGFARTTTDWRQLCADPGVQVVSITSPNSLHKEMALAAIAAGKHVWCEKPLALSAADAREMADAAEAAGVKTLVGYNYLRSPAIQYAKHLVDSGELGRLTYLRILFDEDYMASTEVPFSWRCLKTAAGTGALGDIGSHALGLARFLVGDIVEVAADLSTVVAERPAAAGSGEARRRVENDDIAHAILRFRSGAIGTFTASRVAWGRKNGLDFDLFGSAGGLRFTQERMNEIQLFRPSSRVDDNGFRTILTGPVHPPYARYNPAQGHGLGFNDLKAAEAAHLLEGIGAQTPLFPDFREGFRIEAVCDAIVEAAEKHAWIEVAL